MKKKSIKILLLSLLLALPLSGCGGKQENKPENKEMQKQFDEFIKNEFITEMENDYLSMHILLEHPEDFGVNPKNMKIQIGSKYSEEALDEDRKKLAETIKEFEAFDRDQLSDQQKDTYDCYRYMLDISDDASDEKFDYLGSSFNTMSGDHAQLPSLFADIVMRNEEDVKNVITLLKDVLPYMESNIAYTDKQLLENTMSINADEVISRCQEVVDAGMEGSTLTSMKKHVDEMDLSASVKAKYKKELEEAYRTSFLPAYKKVINYMKKLDKGGNHTGGLATLDNGKEFYEILFRKATGSDDSVKNIKKRLEEEAQNAMLSAQNAVTSNPEALEAYMSNTTSTGYKDYKGILTYLETAYKKDFPDVGKFNYNIEPLASDLATNGIAAYFNIPAIDGTTPKEIRVNNTDKAAIDTISTFTTVAHEGIPGHMYQIQYAYNNLKNPWHLACANFSGYTEGYATYVELYSVNYIDTDDAIKQLTEAMTVYEHAIIALIDIGIHYEGWSIDQLKQFCNEKGLDSSQAQGIYDQICYNPTSFLSYYVGYMEIADLKKEAQKELGDKFTDLGFHTALLESGSAPFSVVERHIDAYIEANK